LFSVALSSDTIKV